MSSKSKIVMCGVHETGYHLAKSLLEVGIEIDYFVTITSNKAEKQKVSGYVSFEGLAKEYNIPIYYAYKYSLRDPRDQSFFEKEEFDLLLQGGWQRLFPYEVLNTLGVGAIGVHGSSEFLPRGRGRSPINWSIIEGKKRFIIHYFLLKPGIDDGDIFHFEIFDINEWDTCRTLYYKNSIVTKKVLLKYIPKLLSGDCEILPQKGEPTYYPKRSPEDGEINWKRNTVFEIYNQIRALTRPYPGAFTWLNGEKVHIWKAYPFDTQIVYPDAEEGQVMEVFSSGDYIVNCLSGLLIIKESTLIPKKWDKFNSYI